MAKEALQSGGISLFDPMVTPAEKWAAYSINPTFHKITGTLNEMFYSSVSHSTLLEYMSSKFNVPKGAFESTSMSSLGNYLNKFKTHVWASISKLIYDWIPTYGTLCRQGRTHSALCPRCQSRVETITHIQQCPDNQAQSARINLLKTFLKNLHSKGTPDCILTIFEFKISIVLDIPYSQCYHTSSTLDTQKMGLINAIRHQNILGWDLFLKGIQSSYWAELYQDLYVNLEHHMTSVVPLISNGGSTG